MASIIDLTLPPGSLGVSIRDENSKCIVMNKTNASSPLHVGDTIVSVNGIDLSTAEGGLETWKTIFASFSHGQRSLVVERPAAAEAAGYAQQPSFGSTQEEKKDEFEPTQPSYASVVKKAATAAAPSPTRKSNRKRTSTTITVNGHTIKRSNNYTVTGINYIHGAFTADESKPKKPKVVPPTAAPKKPRTRPTWETSRLSHNESLRQLMIKDESSRLDFMTRNSDILEPFLEDKVKLLLRANHQVVDKKKKDSVEDSKVVLGSQPDIVVTPLRDYQMVGLEWMLGMHGRGMPFILGDEMGLGEYRCCVCDIALIRCLINLLCTIQI